MTIKSPIFLSSYHLMLCMIDFVFHNLVLDRRRDLLHPDFPGLPPGFSKPSAIIRARPISLPSSILEVLCDLYGGTAIEAKGVKVRFGGQALSFTFVPIDDILGMISLYFLKPLLIFLGCLKSLRLTSRTIPPCRLLPPISILLLVRSTTCFRS
jgi:hypothetical protein